MIRPAQAEDYGAWLALWRGYCAALDGAVPDAVTEGVWRRILTPDEPVGCLLACRPEGNAAGHSQSLSRKTRPVCREEMRKRVPEFRRCGSHGIGLSCPITGSA